MDIFTFAGCAVLVSVMALVIKQQKPEMGQMVTVAAGILLTGALIIRLAPAVSELTAIISGTGAADHLSVILKGLGICLVTQLGADMCRDAGQQTIASTVETAGRVSMAVIALPLLSQVLSSALSIIK